VLMPEAPPAVPAARVAVQSEEVARKDAQSSTLIEEGTCMPWVRVPLEEGGFEWQQDCDPARRANRLRIDNAGNMVTIEVTVHPAFEALRLDRRVGVAEN